MNKEKEIPQPAQPTQADLKFLAVRPNDDLQALIRKAIKLSADPKIKKQAWGWWPRLIANALRVYIHAMEQDKKTAGD